MLASDSHTSCQCDGQGYVLSIESNRSHPEDKMKSVAVRIALLLMFTYPSAATSQVVDELNAYWDHAVSVVEGGDFDGYAATYHPDAVLVSLGNGASYPISQALAGWEQGFIDTREGRMDVSLEFRFTRRLHDATTAHETGIFRYVGTPANGGQPVSATLHFEGLLVKKDGQWVMVMEYQKQPATDEEWAAAGM